MRFWLVLLFLAVASVGCASGDSASVGQTEASDEVETTTTTTAAPETAATTPSTSTTTVEPETTTTSGAPVSNNCRQVVDFGAPATDWFIVNDGVMGGLSDGSGEVAGGMLLFEGTINTDGGGFSSVRTVVPAGTFDEASVIRMRFRTEYARSYELIVDVGADGLDRRVSYFGEIGSTATAEFEDAEVAFADFDARIFGTPVDAPAIDPAEVVGLGIILADGVDGDFALAVEWIEACN